MTESSYVGGERLPPAFYDRPVLQVARDLLGCVVTHGEVAVRLVEVEAYDGERDPGSHAFRGRTPRTAVMFGPPGGLYVYFTYGMHYCANLVCGPEGRAAAVLLRAGEVVTGVDAARSRRASRAAVATGGSGAPDQSGPAPVLVPERRIPTRDLARGPARLARALGLSRAENGVLTTVADAPVRVTGGRPVDGDLVRSGPRVGVAGPGGDAADFPWRFWLAGDPHVSTYRPAVSRRRHR